MWSSHSQLTVNLNRRISDGITDMKNMTSLQVFKTTMKHRLEREENVDTPTAWAYLNSTERYELKTERRIELSQHESSWVQTTIGYLCIHPTFPYRIKLLKRAKKASKKRQRRGLLVLSELPNLLSSRINHS
jgi:hypothetical protein